MKRGIAVSGGKISTEKRKDKRENKIHMTLRVAEVDPLGWRGFPGGQDTPALLKDPELNE